MFKQLKRIAYYVDDIDQAGQWYADFLGMEPILNLPVAKIFQIGEDSMSLIRRPASTSNGVSFPIDAYWEVEDIDAAYEKLIKSGAQSHTPITPVFSFRIAKVIDPFGNLICITGPFKGDHDATVENTSSETARMVAFCRALASTDSRPEIRETGGGDRLARMFIPEDQQKCFDDPAARDHVFNRLIISPLYGYIIARTAYIDEIFRQSLSGRIPQIVFLGAGYDTRAYRFKEINHSTRVFEVDAPSTQNHKRQILQANGIQAPDVVSYVPVNFKTDDLGRSLKNAGYNPSSRTLFVWEGVVYYLKESAVRSTLSFIKTQSPEGSDVVFDYLTQKMDSARPGEPIEFWMAADHMPQFLGNQGFKILDHLGAEEIRKRYLTLKNGEMAEQLFTHFRFVHATT